MLFVACAWPHATIELRTLVPTRYLKMAEGSSTGSESTRNSSSSSSSCSTDTENSSTTVSILDRLKAPRLSILTRKWKIDTNPPKGVRRARGEGANEPKTVSASQRVSEFPKECLTVSMKKLFCTACREELSIRKNVIVLSQACKGQGEACTQGGERERYCRGTEGA